MLVFKALPGSRRRRRGRAARRELERRRRAGRERPPGPRGAARCRVRCHQPGAFKGLFPCLMVCAIVFPSLSSHSVADGFPAPVALITPLSGVISVLQGLNGTGHVGCGLTQEPRRRGRREREAESRGGKGLGRGAFSPLSASPCPPTPTSPGPCTESPHCPSPRALVCSAFLVAASVSLLSTPGLGEIPKPSWLKA